MATKAAQPRRNLRAKGNSSSIGEGQPIDIYGGAAFDPTQNVLDLVAAANLRQDDLRDAARVLFDTKVEHLRYVVELFARFQGEKATLEANRINSIRQVDREEVAKTAASANTAITTLANTTTTMAETLRTNQANLAAAAETRQSNYASEVNKRLSALELGSSEGKGRQTVSDPMQAEMLSEFRAMRLSFAEGQGKAVVIDPIIAREMAESRAEQKRTNEILAQTLGQGAGQKNLVAYISVGISILVGLLVLAKTFMR